MSTDPRFPPDPEHQPRKVSVQKDVLIDTSRDNRPVPIKAVYPVKHDLRNLPVIFWSHGLGGSCDGAGFLARYLASHGYVVINLQHKGSDSALWEGKPGHPWDNIRKSKVTREDTLARFYDVPFVLDTLPQWAKDNPEIGQMMDLETIGMSGHSFGAATTQIMAGQMLGHGEEMFSLKDDRFKAGISYSPSVTYNKDEDPQKLYSPISIPMFYMTGTEDASPVTGESYEYRLDIYDHARGPHQYLMILDEGDHMVFAGSRGKLGENPKREMHERLIRAMALMFWNAYLKDDDKALEWLQSDWAENWLGPEAELRLKNL